MQNTKHTPGPWEAAHASTTEPSPRGELFLNVGNVETGRSVARISRLRTLNDEDKANATLIAAAPELLAVCEDMIRAAGDTIGARAVYYKQFEAMRRAIRKAKGGAS